MSFLIRILPHHLPAFIREEILGELFKATADAFCCQVPAYSHLNYDDCLRLYALFTCEQAQKSLQDRRDIMAVKQQLYQNAYPLGEKLRKWFAVNTVEDVMEIGQVLYQAIGVEVQGNTQGDVTVTRCYFSQFYSGQVCDLISALDDGVFAGLSGGGRLVFSQRLTEGSAFCKAKLNF